MLCGAHSKTRIQMPKSRSRFTLKGAESGVDDPHGDGKYENIDE
jgi:hypothetical protein